MTESATTVQPAPTPAVQPPQVTSPVQEKPPTKSDYSGVGIIVSIMLMFTLIVFVQYVIGDLQETYAGKRPQMDSYYQFQQGSNNTYLEKSSGKEYTYADANSAFNKNFSLPYESKRLVVSMMINVPLFILGLLMVIGKNVKRSSYRLGVNAFFAASVINMLRLLGELASFAFAVNQKLTMYGVSFVLIVVFFGSIVYIQERHAKANS